MTYAQATNLRNLVVSLHTMMLIIAYFRFLKRLGKSGASAFTKQLGKSHLSRLTNKSLLTQTESLGGGKIPRVGFRSFEPSISLDTFLSTFDQNVVKTLESIKAVQDQHSVLLQDILTHVSFKNGSLFARPDDIPRFPLDCKEDFFSFETWLKVESNFAYMKCRLAEVGGSNGRNATMKMLAFLITNKLGLTFNWAGSAPRSALQPEKKAFKTTNVYSLINAAVKLAFAEKECFISDQEVIRAIQDWLKLAKTRYTYRLSKNQ